MKSQFNLENDEWEQHGYTKTLKLYRMNDVSSSKVSA